LKEEKMLKTISAAALAVSVLATPSLAAPNRTTHAPVIKTAPLSAKVLNANARWVRHHRHHRHHHRHHRYWR
jgi:Ni/Co efflux regulator RcnB